MFQSTTSIVLSQYYDHVGKKKTGKENASINKSVFTESNVGTFDFVCANKEFALERTKRYDAPLNVSVI